MPARRGSQKPRGTLLQAHSRHAEAWGRPWLRHPRGASPGRRGPCDLGLGSTSEAGGLRSVRCGRADTPPWTPGGACLWRGQWLQSRTRRLVHLLQPRDERTDPPPREGVARGQTALREQRQGGAGHRRPGIRSWVGVPCRPWEPTGVSLMHSGAASEGSPHPRLCPGADCAAASPHTHRGTGLLPRRTDVSQRGLGSAGGRNVWVCRVPYASRLNMNDTHRVMAGDTAYHLLLPRESTAGETRCFRRYL